MYYVPYFHTFICIFSHLGGIYKQMAERDDIEELSTTNTSIGYFIT